MTTGLHSSMSNEKHVSWEMGLAQALGHEQLRIQRLRVTVCVWCLEDFFRGCGSVMS